MKRSPAFFAMLAALASLTLFATACGSDNAAEATTTADATTTATTETATAVPDPAATAVPDPTAAAVPDPTATAAPDPVTTARIVSLSPTATEMLFAIGAGDLVIAADEFSDYPPEAPTTPGLSGYTPNIESIAALEPTLVISESPIEGLDAIGVENVVQFAAATFADVYTQLDALGALTGHEKEAADVVVLMQADIEVLRASVVETDEPLTYFHELDPTLYTATSSTFIGEVYSLFGLVNIADAYDPDGEFFSYPQLTEEVVVTENPDLIFLADAKCCAATAESIAERPGWDQLAAVANGNVVELDDDIASRWGPRIVGFVEAVALAINTSQQASVS